MEMIRNLEYKDKAARVLVTHRNTIEQSWLKLAKQDNIFNNKILLSFSKITIENIIDYFIKLLSSQNPEFDISKFVLVAEEMVNKDISYHDFVKTMQYFEESYIKTFLMEIKESEVEKYLALINNLCNESIANISEEYFKAKDSTVYALAKLAELRDGTTGSHLENTREYAAILSRELKMDNNFIKNIERASMLHDIGKVGIRDSILLKPGKLTREEFEEMKQHTIIGAETINQIISNTNTHQNYLVMAREIALCHHEKYDGSGYPFGLTKGEIPIEARIFALADVYDAIVSKRPYKEPLSHKEAVEIIVSCSNTHFDPEVVRAFTRVEQEFSDINATRIHLNN